MLNDVQGLSLTVILKKIQIRITDLNYIMLELVEIVLKINKRNYFLCDLSTDKIFLCTDGTVSMPNLSDCVKLAVVMKPELFYVAKVIRSIVSKSGYNDLLSAAIHIEENRNEPNYFENLHRIL
ncbi:hypothetical protein MHBO_001351 [Bonamia ostreae]|uniref:Uncharacterized protein n=1 Tax=Bonamia ostreae TaxID=126728 RepID=A0ABV2AJ73_9EUKA